MIGITRDLDERWESQNCLLWFIGGDQHLPGNVFSEWNASLTANISSCYLNCLFSNFSTWTSSFTWLIRAGIQWNLFLCLFDKGMNRVDVRTTLQSSWLSSWRWFLDDAIFGSVSETQSLHLSCSLYSHHFSRSHSVNRGFESREQTRQQE